MTQTNESTKADIDATLRLYSFINRIGYTIRKISRLSRKNYREKPVWELQNLTNTNQKRIEQLRVRYNVKFENHLSRANTLENYHLLDILDQLKNNWNWHPQMQQRLADVGSKNFYYAATLNAFFNPSEMIGIELDAFGLYRDFHSRFSYAQYYIKPIKGAKFIGNDFCKTRISADILTFFYPFVIPEPLVRWSLPLKEFKPQKIFDHAYKTLSSNGLILIINQGNEEFEAAKKYLELSHFKMQHYQIITDTIQTRFQPPIASLWIKEPHDPA